MFTEKGAEEYEMMKEQEKTMTGILDGQASDNDRSKISNKMTPEKAKFIIDHMGNQRWRIENLYYIVNEDGEKISFKPNFIQREILEAIYGGNDDYIRHIILKYRQGGVSTLFTILLLDEFLWGGKNIYNVIIAHERKLLISLFKKIKFALDSMDPEFKIFIPQMDSDNANEIFIKSTNNRLGVTLDVRGETPTRIHITELAWREHAKQASLLLAVNPLRKAKITIESTANGVGDPFYNLCMQARTMQGTYKLLFYPWFIEKRNKTAIPDGYGLKEDERLGGLHRYKMHYDDKEKQIQKQYDLNDEQLYWRRQQIHDAMALGEDGNKKFDQENPDSIDTAFVASGNHVFDLSLSYRINKPIKVIGDIKIYGPPEDGMCFGVDTAEGGSGGDYSTICGKSRSGKTLVTFKKKCEDFELAEAMDQILSLEFDGKYFLGTIQVERNKGSAFTSEVRRGYDWAYLLLKGRDATAISDKTKEYYGFWTGGGSKELLIRDFRKGIYNQLVQITEDAHKEISTYIYHNGKAEAMSGHHDDMIMAEMLAYNAVLYEHYIATYNTERFTRRQTKMQRTHEMILSGKIHEDEYDEEHESGWVAV